VRQGAWKLVSKYPGDWELYSMEQDRTELHDRAAQQPGVVEELTTIYDAWARRCGVLPWEQIRPQRRAGPLPARPPVGRHST